MEKEIVWILSHNSTPPSAGQWIRHHMFSKYSDKENYQTSIFSSSYVHLSNKNFNSDDPSMFIKKNVDGVNYYFVNLESYADIKFKRISNMLLFFKRLVFNSVKKTKEIPNVIYASSPDPLAWLAGYFIAKKHGAKFIVETRDLWPETFIELGVIKKNSMLAKILYKLERFIYIRANKLVFTFEGGYDYLLEKNIPINKNNTYSINNGVDIDSFYRNIELNNYEDKDLSNPDTKKLVYTGSLGRANNVSTLLGLAKELKEKGNDNVRVIIFGEGLEKTGMVKYKEENHLNNVIFKDRVDKKYIPSILNQADINLITGHQNNLYRFGYSFNKLFDYLASGKPIVSTVKTNYDLITLNNLGVTVDLEQENSFYDGIASILNSEESELLAMRQRSLSIAKEYDYKKLSEKFYTVISS